MTMPNSNKFFFKDTAGTTNLFTISTSQTFSHPKFASDSATITLNGSDLEVDAGTRFAVNTDTRFVSGRGCGIKLNYSTQDYTFEIQGSGSSGFWINGTFKSAIVPTSRGYNSLFCMESPEVWFMDFTGEDRRIDPMFEEVTEGDRQWVKTETGWQVWRRRKGYSKNRFDAKTRKDFEANERFLGMALAKVIY